MRYFRAFSIVLILISLYSCAQNTQNIEELSNKNSEYYYNLGMASLTAGNYAAAIANFKKAILKNEYNYKAYDKIALAYANVGDYKKAIKNIDKSINIKPDYYQAILDKAIILQTTNNIKEAIKTLNICIKNDYCSLRPQAYYQLANIYKSMDNTKEYIKNLNLAILYDRDFNTAKLDLAKAYIKNNMCSDKKIEEKVQYLLDNKEITALDTPNILLLKARCYIQAKEFKKASTLMQKILFKDDIPQKYKDKAIELSKDLIALEYMNNSSMTNPNQNIGFATIKNTNESSNKNSQEHTSSPKKESIPKTQNTPVLKNINQKEEEAKASTNTKNILYYQLGSYDIKEYAKYTYLKAEKYGFKTYMVKNGKSIIVYSEVPQDKLKEFKKIFPFAFEIKDISKLNSLQKLTPKELEQPLYYQLGSYDIKEYAKYTYLKAEKYGFKTYMVKNGKSIIVYSEVPQDKLKEFKKIFPFAFEIKDISKLKKLKGN